MKQYYDDFQATDDKIEIQGEVVAFLVVDIQVVSAKA